MLQLKKDLRFLPKKKNILIHLRLKNLISKKKNYKSDSTKIYNYFCKNFKTVVIPSFTYSYVKIKRFNPRKTKSEVGRFSEEIRKLGLFRTYDPLFSFLVSSNFKGNKEYILSSFSNKSMFAEILKKNYLIINLNLNKLVCSLFHLIELKNNVPYRNFKTIKGKFNSKNIKYDFFMRNLKYQLNRDKILKDLIKGNIVKEKKTCFLV